MRFAIHGALPESVPMLVTFGAPSARRSGGLAVHNVVMAVEGPEGAARQALFEAVDKAYGVSSDNRCPNRGIEHGPSEMVRLRLQGNRSRIEKSLVLSTVPDYTVTMDQLHQRGRNRRRHLRRVSCRFPLVFLSFAAMFNGVFVFLLLLVPAYALSGALRRGSSGFHRFMQPCPSWLGVTLGGLVVARDHLELPVG